MTKQAKERTVTAIEQIINVNDILDDILVAIGENCEPADVFGEDQLDEWALQNGYSKDT